jgi:release factor glutamine methyltransferase
MRRLLVRITHPFLRWWYTRWNARERRYGYHGLDLLVLPGVFHPGIFGSTHAMAEWVARLPLKGRRFLELGAGSGMVALVAAREGAHVTASDVNAQAVRNVERNARRNRLDVRVVRSDLFEHLPERYDVIAINPPYYSRDPANDAERSFFAGKDLSYFQRLLPELARRIIAGSEVFMVLSMDLDRTGIDLALMTNGLRTEEVHRRARFGESQIVYRLVLR